MSGEHLLLIIVCLSWCALHSLLISGAVSTGIKRLLGRFTSCYRLIYNGVALLTLLPLAAYIHARPGEVVFDWSGADLLRLSLLAAALLVFFWGGKQYDMGLFLGISQLRSGSDESLLSGKQEFSRQGIHRVVRHPWYAGSLLFLWSALPRYSLAACIAGTVFSIYLVVGAFLEERRLETEFGEAYRNYQREVSMFFPWKWLKRKWVGEDNGTG